MTRLTPASSFGTLFRPPLEAELPLRLGAVPEVEIDQRLIGDVELLGEPFEVLDGRVVQANRDALLEAARIGVLLRLRKIVVRSHAVTSVGRRTRGFPCGWLSARKRSL